MQVFVTGGVGFATDAHDVFSNIDTKLLLATVLLVLVLLGAIYRSVLVALSPADRRLLRLYDHPGARLRAGEVGRDRLLQQHEHPDRPHVRGGDRLLPLTRLPLPRGAAADRGQARGHGARVAARGARDLRQRHDGVAGDAHPGARRQQEHELPRPRGGDFGLHGDGCRPDPAPDAADDLRAQGVLAPPRRRGLRPRASFGGRSGPVAPVRRLGAEAAGGCADHYRSPSSSRERSACSPTRSTTRRPASSSTRWRPSRGSTSWSPPSPRAPWRRRPSWWKARADLSRPPTSARSRTGCGVSMAWPPPRDTGVRSTNGQIGEVDAPSARTRSTSRA